MISRRQFLTVVTAVGASSITGCLGDGSGGEESSDETDIVNEETSEVSMSGSQFHPRNIHVDVGTTVTWVNEDSTDHTVTNASDNWRFDETVTGGESVEYTFEDSGVYDVYCSFHGFENLTGMSMKIGVGEATIENPLGDTGGDDSDSNIGGYY